MFWNIDLTLVDVAQVTRAAYAEAFEKVTGYPLVHLTLTAGRTDSEIFFEFLARNSVPAEEHLLGYFTEALAESFAKRRADLPVKGRAMPGAHEALAALGTVPDTVQTVLTGSIMSNALAKLAAFGLDAYLDPSIGGYGSENYPKGSLLQFARMRAEESQQSTFPESATFYITDSARDVEAALIGRATPIAVASGSATESQLRGAGASIVFDDLLDPAPLVSAIRSTAA